MKGLKRKQHKPAKSGHPTQSAAVGDMKSRKLPGKRLAIGLTVLLLLVAGIGLGYTYYKNRSSGTKVKPTTVCTSNANSQLVAQTSAVLRPSETAKLQPLVEQIKKLDGYDRDPNCLYPIIQYYVYTGDTANAQMNYDKLVLVFGSKSKFSTDYGSSVNLQTIKAQIDNTKQLQQQIKNNTKYFN